MAKNRKKLCVLMGSHFSAIKGGAQYQAEMLINELVRKNEFNIFNVVRHADKSYISEGYETIRIPVPSALMRFDMYVDAPMLLRTLNEIKPDVIYQRGLKSYTGIAAYYAKKNKKRFIFHVASDFNLMSYKELKNRSKFSVPLIEKKIGEYGLRQADSVVVQTMTQRELLVHNYGIKASAIVKNFHPYPEEILEKKMPVKIIWVANFKRVKRPELFVKLANELSYLDNVEFLMIGRAGDSKLYRSLHEEIKTINSLSYIGEQSQESVNRYIANAHVLVNTSLIEGFPNTFIQAWMRKVPVVSIGINIDGLLDDGSIGYCGENYDSMKSHVLQLIEDHNLRSEMGERAQAYAFKEHTMSNVEQLISIMQGEI